MLIRDALRDAGLPPSAVGYLECHGTGTPLGDPIEVQAAGQAYGVGRQADNALRLGAVKANIGHSEGAAGIAGLVKVTLCIHRCTIPPVARFKELNPNIGRLEDIPATIPLVSEKWEGLSTRRTAGVSSFAFSGTNAHAILTSVEGEEEPKVKPEAIPPTPHLLCVTACTRRSLEGLAKRYADLLERDGICLEDICYSARKTRTRFRHRLAVAGSTKTEMAGLLRSFLHDGSGTCNPGLSVGDVGGRGKRRVAFIFPGEGAQYLGMGKELYTLGGPFARTLEECDRLLRPHVDGQSILTVMHADPTSEGATERFRQPQYAQPALFALEYSLAQMWKTAGVVPEYVMGHGLGEYVAAVVSGVMGLEDGLQLVARRAKLMEAVQTVGRMVAVGVTEVEAMAAIAFCGVGAEVSVAAVNGPRAVVVSGLQSGVDAVVSRLQQLDHGVQCTVLEVSHGFHSPQMDGMLQPLQELAGEVTFAPRPNIPVMFFYNRSGVIT